MKRNIKLIISYDGTRYFGWEHQPNTDMTIQGKLENVLNMMLTSEEGKKTGDVTGSIEKTADGTVDAAEFGKGVTVIGAGRTDAGVHARAMTANVILDTEKTCDEILAYMNRYLPEDISVNEVKVCSDRFHARYNALGKTYRYTCWFGASKPVFDRKYVTVLEKEPDVEKMIAASEFLIGTHDFKSFC